MTRLRVGDTPRELEALWSELLSLRARVAALEQRGRGPRDAADERLLEALRALAEGGTFTAPDVLDRGRLEPAWQAHLEAADIETAADLGYLLRRCTGVCGLARDGKNGRGVIWRFRTNDDASSIVTDGDD